MKPSYKNRKCMYCSK